MRYVVLYFLLNAIFVLIARKQIVQAAENAERDDDLLSKKFFIVYFTTIFMFIGFPFGVYLVVSKNKM